MKKGIVITPADLKGCDWIEKCRQLGLNTLGIHSGGGANHDILAVLGETATPEFRSKAAAANLELEYECHITGSILTEELFKEHPEYFQESFISGRRVSSGGWCISNPEFRDLLAEKVCELTEKLPSSTHNYYYWSADQILAWCHCQHCSKYSMSDLNALAMNWIQESICKVDPQAELAYLGYHSALLPPRKVKPNDGLFLEFAPYPRCYRHAIDDPECEYNRKQWNALQEQLQVFDPAKAQILEYWLDVSYFSDYREPHISPPLKRDILRRDLEAYMKLGIRNFTTFAVYMNGEFLEKEGDESLVLYAETLNEFLK